MSCGFGKYFGVAVFIFCVNQQVVIGFLDCGCNFKNEDYDVDLGESILNPVFGREVTPVIMQSTPSLLELIDKMMEIIGGELEKNLYNDVNRLFHFYDYFKAQKEPFLNFFDTWKPRVHTQGSTVESLLSLLETLEKKLPHLKGHMYPAANINIESVAEYRAKLKALKVKTPGDLDITPEGEPIINHATGVIRISVDGRPGFILLDSRFGYTKPIVIMESSIYPEQNVAQFKHARFTYNILPNNPHHVDVSVYDTEINRNLPSSLIYIGKPFCSFMAHTIKPGVFFGYRSIIQSNKNGDPIRGFYFEMTPLPSNNSTVNLKFGIGLERINAFNETAYEKSDYLYDDIVENTPGPPQLKERYAYLLSKTDDLFKQKKGETFKIIKKARAIMSDAAFSKPYFQIIKSIKEFFENPVLNAPLKKRGPPNRFKSYFWY